MGEPFLDLPFDLDLQGSASGLPEPGMAEERSLDGAGSWAKELLQQLFSVPWLCYGASAI